METHIYPSDQSNAIDFSTPINKSLSLYLFPITNTVAAIVRMKRIMYSDETNSTLVIFEKQQSVFLLNFSKSVNSNYFMRLLRISSALLILLTTYTDALGKVTFYIFFYTIVIALKLGI